MLGAGVGADASAERLQSPVSSLFQLVAPSGPEFPASQDPLVPWAGLKDDSAVDGGYTGQGCGCSSRYCCC